MYNLLSLTKEPNILSENMKNSSKVLSNQLRAIYALLMREVQTRFGAKSIGLFASLIEVIGHVFVFALIKYLLAVSGPDGINVILFLITGIVPFFYFRNIITKMSNALSANKGLLSISQISFLDFYYARFILETILVLINLPLILILANYLVLNLDLYYYKGFVIGDIVMVFEGLFYLGFLGFGYGLILSALCSLYPALQLVSSIFMRVLYFTSGILFSASDMIPHQYHGYLYYNPIVHCMELLRAGFFMDYHPDKYFMDYSYLSFLVLILLFVGFLLTFRSKLWILR